MSRQTERPMRGRLVERKTGAGNERKKNEEKYKQRVDEWTQTEFPLTSVSEISE